MHVTFGTEEAHVAKLKKGLAVLGPDFIARLCWWCHGTTYRNFSSCDVCGKGRYGSALGLLIGNEPAPESVVNQVLVAAEREP